MAEQESSISRVGMGERCPPGSRRQILIPAFPFDREERREMKFEKKSKKGRERKIEARTIGTHRCRCSRIIDEKIERLIV